ncbi:MAG: PDZ domain-containing protein [Candidatus Tumulicola sp.]
MRFARILIVTLIALLEVAAFVTTLTTYGRPVAEFGYNVAADGVTISAVEPGLPAAKAGIEAGDKISYARLSVAGRLNAIQSEWVAPGSELQLDVTRDGQARTITLRPVELPSLYAVIDLSFAFAGLALGAVSLALVLLRPSRMTWGFALVPLPLLLPDVLVQWSQRASTTAGLTYEIGVALLYALQTAGMMIFASRFPTDTTRGPNRLVDRLAIPVGMAVAAVYIYVDWCIWLSSTPPPTWILFAQDYVAPLLPSLAALLAISTTYLISSGNLRSRLAPTLVAFVLLIVAGVVQQFGTVLTSNPGLMLFLYFCFAFAAVLVAVAVAYGVIRHRVIDVSFIVGRTLVYSILTIFAVSMFTLIEFLFGKLLERGGLATVLEILAAVSLGVSLNFLHNRLDKFIDVVLFRRRHLAEARLERAAATLPHATSKELVADMLVAEPSDALDLASAAVFVMVDDGKRYARTRAEGWSDRDVTELDADDHLVVRLRAELRPAHLEDLRWPRTDLPTGKRQPLYAAPVAVGNRLDAIALYGGHNGGEDLDPDERQSLRALASAAALAYDHIRAQELRRKLEETRSENASLRRVERTLTALLQERLKETGEA